MKDFIERWKNRGNENSEAQIFWLEFFLEIFEIEEPTKLIEFQKTVKLSHVSFIDAYVTSTRIIVETLNKFYNTKMAYDEKYKLRTLSYRNEGHTLSQTSAIFQISITTIRKWEKQLKKEGNLKRHPITRRFKKIDPEKLRAYIRDNPDAYLREIAEVFQCCQTAIRKALIRLKITRKKRPRVIMSKNLKK